MNEKHQKGPDESNPAAPLETILAENIATDRRAYASAWHRAELVGQVLGQDERMRQLGDILAADTVLERPRHYFDFEGAGSHLMSLSTAGSIERLFIASPPYDTEWTSFQPPGALGTAARGQSAFKQTGKLFIDLTETYVDRPVAEGDWMWAGAGIGIWFKPKSPNTYIRVSGLVQ
jgi:hypothetical protein